MNDKSYPRLIHESQFHKVTFTRLNNKYAVIEYRVKPQGSVEYEVWKRLDN